MMLLPVDVDRAANRHMQQWMPVCLLYHRQTGKYFLSLVIPLYLTALNSVLKRWMELVCRL